MDTGTAACSHGAAGAVVQQCSCVDAEAGTAGGLDRAALVVKRLGADAGVAVAGDGAGSVVQGARNCDAALAGASLQYFSGSVAQTGGVDSDLRRQEAGAVVVEGDRRNVKCAIGCNLALPPVQPCGVERQHAGAGVLNTPFGIGQGGG